MLRTAFYSRAGAALERRADFIVVCHDLLMYDWLYGFFRPGGGFAASLRVLLPVWGVTAPRSSLQPSVSFPLPVAQCQEGGTIVANGERANLRGDVWP